MMNTSAEWNTLIADLEARRDTTKQELSAIARSREEIALSIVQNDPAALKTAATLDKRKREKETEASDLEAALVQARAGLRRAADDRAREDRLAKADLLDSLAARHAGACADVDEAMAGLMARLNDLFALEREIAASGVRVKRTTGELTRAMWYAHEKTRSHGLEREAKAFLGNERPLPGSWRALAASARSGRMAESLAKQLRLGADPETAPERATDAV